MKLRIVTLNAWGLPFPIAFHPRYIRFPRIARFLQERGFHVAALQEVWRGAPRLELPGLVLPDHRHGDSGLALVSQLPVLDKVSRAFKAARGIDAWKHKGWLRALVQLPDGRAAHVVSTHLQAGGGPKNAHVRARQVDEILEHLADLDGPQVVLGDFNLHARQLEDRDTAARLEAAGFDDAAAAIPSTYVFRNERFDRILLRDGGDLAWTAHSARLASKIPFLSDHLPVEAELSLAAAAAASVA